MVSKSNKLFFDTNVTATSVEQNTGFWHLVEHDRTARNGQATPELLLSIDDRNRAPTLMQKLGKLKANQFATNHHNTITYRHPELASLANQLGIVGDPY